MAQSALFCTWGPTRAHRLRHLAFWVVYIAASSLAKADDVAHNTPKITSLRPVVGVLALGRARPMRPFALFAPGPNGLALSPRSGVAKKRRARPDGLVRPWAVGFGATNVTDVDDRRAGVGLSYRHRHSIGRVGVIGLNLERPPFRSAQGHVARRLLRRHGPMVCLGLDFTRRDGRHRLRRGLLVEASGHVLLPQDLVSPVFVDAEAQLKAAWSPKTTGRLVTFSDIDVHALWGTNEAWLSVGPFEPPGLGPARKRADSLRMQARGFEDHHGMTTQMATMQSGVRLGVSRAIEAQPFVAFAHAKQHVGQAPLWLAAVGLYLEARTHVGPWSCVIAYQGAYRHQHVEGRLLHLVTAALF